MDKTGVRLLWRVYKAQLVRDGKKVWRWCVGTADGDYAETFARESIAYLFAAALNERDAAVAACTGLGKNVYADNPWVIKEGSKFRLRIWTQKECGVKAPPPDADKVEHTVQGLEIDNWRDENGVRYKRFIIHNGKYYIPLTHVEFIKE